MTRLDYAPEAGACVAQGWLTDSTRPSQKPRACFYTYAHSNTDGGACVADSLSSRVDDVCDWGGGDLLASSALAADLGGRLFFLLLFLPLS